MQNASPSWNFQAKYYLCPLEFNQTICPPLGILKAFKLINPLPPRSSPLTSKIFIVRC